MRRALALGLLVLCGLGVVPAMAGSLSIVLDEPRVPAASGFMPSFVRVHRNALAPDEGDIARAISSGVYADYLERFPKSDFMLLAHVAVTEASANEGESVLSISCGVSRRSGTSPVLAESYKPEFMVAVIGGDLSKDPVFITKSVGRVCRSAQRKAVALMSD